MTHLLVTALALIFLMLTCWSTVTVVVLLAMKPADGELRTDNLPLKTVVLLLDLSLLVLAMWWYKSIL